MNRVYNRILTRDPSAYILRSYEFINYEFINYELIKLRIYKLYIILFNQISIKNKRFDLIIYLLSIEQSQIIKLS